MKAINKNRVIRAKQEVVKEFQYQLSGSKPEKILFDHLPKCGGSSLNEYLRAHFPLRKTFTIDGTQPTNSVEMFKALPADARYNYDLIQGHLAHKLIDYVHPESLTITVFREPVDRIISHYYFAKRKPGHYLYSTIQDSGLSLEAYATSDVSTELRNWYTTHFSGLSLADAERNPKESVAKAVDVVLDRYDIIGLLDDFLSFTETLRTRANFRYEYKNERVNVTQNRPALDSVEQQTILKITTSKSLDVELYRRIREAIS